MWLSFSGSNFDTCLGYKHLEDEEKDRKPSLRPRPVILETSRKDIEG